MAYCLPMCPKFYCKFKFVLPSTCSHHCQEICQSSCPAHCCASQQVSTIWNSHNQYKNYVQLFVVTIVPIFCCKVSPSMPSSCPSSCSVSCILPFQQHCCQEHYPPNFSTQSPATCPSPIAMCNPLWRHVPGALFSSVLLRTIVIFNKINTNRKCSAKLFAAPKLCNTYTICPSFSSYYCSHSWLQYCMGR